MKTFIIAVLTTLGLGKYSHFTQKHIGVLNDISSNKFKFRLKRRIDNKIEVISDCTAEKILIIFTVNENDVVESVDILNT